MAQKGKIYLIPCQLSENPAYHPFPNHNIEIIKSLSHFLVENERTARRFISSLKLNIKIEDLHFTKLDKDTNAEALIHIWQKIEQGHSFGILSEAGCPGIADPGSIAVKIAHEKEIEVVPLVGPSSILLSLMASGFNGQGFSFNGYLPIEKELRKSAIKKLENEVYNKNFTQIFIETPYRNQQLFNDILAVCAPNTLLSISIDLVGKTQYINTLPIKKWKSVKLDFNKIPAVFLLYKNDSL